MLDRRVLVPLGIVGIVLVLLAVVAWDLLSDRERWRSEAVAKTALARIHKGMPMKEAERLLDDAWHHAQCRSSVSTTTDHLFLYGSQDLRHTAAISVTARGPPGEQVVTGRSRVEHYNLHRYDSCTSLDLSSL